MILYILTSFSVNIGSMRATRCSSVYYLPSIKEINLILYSSIKISNQIKQNTMNEWQSYKYKGVYIKWKQLTLTLKRQFNTAHSSSKQRRNFVVKVEIQGRDDVGIGECGLPPKKENCYLADVNDCFEFMKVVSQKLEGLKMQDEETTIGQIQEQLFQGIPLEYFKACRKQAIQASKDKSLHFTLLQILIKIRPITTKQTRAPYSALQFAIFDLYAKTLSLSLTELIFPQVKSSFPCSFYSVSHQDPNSMIANIKQALSYTHFIKLKCSDDANFLTTLMLQIQKETQGVVKMYIIDANASWSAETCHCFLEDVNKHKQITDKILYLEQPFPIVMNQEQKQKWKQINLKSELTIVADESFFGSQQIQEVQQICKGVNVKTQKAGGAINSVRAGLEAKKLNMELMLGTMVTSHLGSTQTYCLHPLTQYLDTDGSLLVKEPEVKGGFQWGKQGYLSQSKQYKYGTTIDPSLFQ